MLSIFRSRPDAPKPGLCDRIHYACGKNIFSGWLNVDGFDVSYPDGQVDPRIAGHIYRADLSKAHPFPNDYFKFGYSEDFLEHLPQAQSLVFLHEARRTFAPGGVLRLSFPGLAGILRRHFSGATREDMERGVNDAYTRWHHEHFYCAESLQLVARHLGWREVEVVSYGESRHPELRGLETRPDQRDLNLIAELTK